MKLTRILWIALAIGVAIWGFLRWSGGAERAVNRRLDALEEVLEKDGAEGDLAAAARSRELASFFVEGFRIEAPQVGGTLTDRGRLMQTFLGYRRRYERIDAAFRDRELILDEAEGIAELGCVATLSARGGVGVSRDRFRLRMVWRREGSEWRLSEVELLEVLEGSLGF